MKNIYIKLARAVVAVKGEDAQKFLQGLITNDINKVTSTSAIYTCLLTPQGKFLYDFFICEFDGSLTLDCNLLSAEDLIKRLSMYKLRSKVELVDLTADYDVHVLLGDNSFSTLNLKNEAGTATTLEAGVAYTDPRTSNMFIRTILKKDKAENFLKENGFGPGKLEDYDQLRIDNLVADGDNDLEKDKAFPLQYRMEELNAIDFKKGCYVGQEVTARSKYRGVVRKSTFRVKASSTLPEAGTAIMLDGKQIGELRSHVGDVGIALLDIETAEKTKQDNVFPVIRDISISVL